METDRQGWKKQRLRRGWARKVRDEHTKEGKNMGPGPPRDDAMEGGNGAPGLKREGLIVIGK